MPIAASSRASRMAFDLTERDGRPGEAEIVPLALGGLPLRDHRPLVVRRIELELVLHQEAAAHPLEVERTGAAAHRQLHHAERLLRGEDRDGLVVERGRDDDLDEEVAHRLGGGASTTVLNAITEPKADTGSVARAFRNASTADVRHGDAARRRCA